MIIMMIIKLELAEAFHTFNRFHTSLTPYHFTDFPENDF